MRPTFLVVITTTEHTGIIDCSERALETGLHVHQHDAFGNMPQMQKVICLDNDLRRRYTTRQLFEDVSPVSYVPTWCFTMFATLRVVFWGFGV